MKHTLRFAVLALLLPVATGCAESPKERLEGTWRGEAVENFHPAQTGRAVGWAQQMSFEFKGSRVTVKVPAERPRSGTFKVAKVSEDDQLRVQFLRPHGGGDEVAFQLVGEDQMRWVLSDGRSIMLRKQSN